MPKAVLSHARRRVIAAMALFSALPWLVVRDALAGDLTPTPSQPEGPFYPRTLPEDRDADLLVVAGRSGRAEGTPLYLEGTVRSVAGTPLSGAHVEIWQCDAHGRYHYVNDGGSTPPDENFQGYGETVTDAEGRYKFRTIRPVAYPGRGPHIHLKAEHPDARPLTTQIYAAGDPLDADAGFVRFYGRESRDRLTVALTAATNAEPGALRARFDIVLATKG